MKIVNRETFLQVPENTVYSKFEPNCFDGIEIKGETYFNDAGKPIDFYSQQISDAVDYESVDEFDFILQSSIDNGTEFKMNFNLESRDGMYDAGQMFAIWDADDVKALIARLQKTLS